MFLEGALRPEDGLLELLSGEGTQFVGPGDVRTATNWPLMKAALAHLGEVWPRFVRFDELVRAARARYDSQAAQLSTDDDVARLSENLLYCCLGGSVRLHSHPAAFVADVSAMPLASRVSRAQARRGGAVVNRRHETVALDLFDRQVVDLLDGKRSHAQLVEELAVAVGEKRLVAVAQERPLETYEEAKAAFGPALPAALKRLAHSALLIG
jgi:methyltransferase-like protein